MLIPACVIGKLSYGILEIGIAFVEFVFIKLAGMWVYRTTRHLGETLGFKKSDEPIGNAWCVLAIHMAQPWL